MATIPLAPETRPEAPVGFNRLKVASFEFLKLKAVVDPISQLRLHLEGGSWNSSEAVPVQIQRQLPSAYPMRL